MYKIYRLLNGDEVIGSVVHENNQCSTVEEPFLIDYNYSPKTGRTNVTMTRYMAFSANDTIQINRDHITSEQQASEDAVDYYLSVLVQWGDDGVQYEPDPADKILEETNEFTEKINDLLDVIQPNANTSLH